jgi:ElaB/YqjD/DUF883 family membrane-anchored ribosome-binding protein
MAGNTSSPGNMKDRAEAAGAGMGAAAGRKVGEAATQAQQAASNLGQKAQELSQKAQDAASQVGHKAQEAASAVAEKTDDALSSMGERMTSLAGTIREKAPHEGTIGSAAATVADRLQSGGQYLQEHGIQEITEDLATVIRRHPVQSVFLALGIGFFVGMASRR